MDYSRIESNPELARFLEMTHDSFSAFVHASDPDQQHEMQGVLLEADNSVAEAIHEFSDLPARNVDPRLQSIGKRMLTGFETDVSDVADDHGPSSSENEDERKQRLIEIFDAGINAFFPEGITLSEKARLFSLSVEADRIPSRTREEYVGIFEARAKLVEALIGKRYPDKNIYSGMCVADIYETANWLYGGDESTYNDRGWSIDPVVLYKSNPNLLRHDKARVEAASVGLSELLDAPIEKVIIAAYRGIYRYMHYPEEVASEIQELVTMGIDPKRIARRPDLTNFPLKVILEKQKEYQDMGIPLDVIHNNVQLYVYKPETIAKRIETLTQYLEKLSQNILSSEESEIMLAEYKSRKSLIIDFGANRIKPNLELVLRYAGPADWIEALSTVQAEDIESKIGSILYNILKVNHGDLEKAMGENPQGNIFNIAREITLRSRRNKRV